MRDDDDATITIGNVDATVDYDDWLQQYVDRLAMIFLILTGHLILAFIVFTVIFIEEQ